MESIGGCRLVRRLGEGARAEVYLGRPQHEPVEQGGFDVGETSAQVPLLVAVKVYRPTTDPASIDAEIEALGRASSPHLLSLRDLGMDAAGRPALLLERLGPTSLARLVADRTLLAAGEAVTILAPIVAAVGELHRVGVSHGGIRMSAVLFRDDGAPVLTGFGRAESFGPMPDAGTERSSTIAETAAVPSVRRDLADAAALVRSVVECTPDGAARRDLLEAVDGSADDAAEDPAGWVAGTVERLFDYADPLPVSFDPVPREAIPVRGSAVDVVSSPEPADDTVPRSRGAALAVRLLELIPVALPDWLWEMVDHERGQGTGVGAAVRRFLAPVRRAVWIAAACVGAALVAGLGWVGFVESTAHGDEASAAVPVDREGDGGSADPFPETPATTPPTSDPPTSDPSENAEADPDEDSDDLQRATDLAAIAGDDPAAAAVALLRSRHECLVDVSAECLAGVDQTASAAEEADLGLLRSESMADPIPSVGTTSPVVTGRWGGTALVTVPVAATADSDGGTAGSAMISVLVVAGEDGWRIRDLTAR